MKSILVLGTSHRVQGATNFPDAVVDPNYERVIREIVSEQSIDFIFEEGSACGPTVAERIARELQDIRYLDIDPSVATRHQFGIVDKDGRPFPDSSLTPSQAVEEQEKREVLWCKRISERDFDNGLLICGYLHVLSMVFRLRAAGLDPRYDHYVPHEQLCRKPHVL